MTARNLVLQDKIAIVTGGAKGLGAAVAAEFDSEGAYVVVTDIDAAGAEKTAGRTVQGRVGRARRA